MNQFMTTLRQFEPLSIDDYLDLEEGGEVRHEYINGVIYAMVGASARHNLISGSLFANLRAHLKGSPCRVFQSDMKVRSGEVFYYPDVMVSCGALSPEDRFVTDPKLIIEVLSPSTESKDRLEKLVMYQNIPNLQEYVLVSQDKVSIEIYRRNDEVWNIVSFVPKDNLEFKSIGLSLPIETVYEDIMGFAG